MTSVLLCVPKHPVVRTCSPEPDAGATGARQVEQRLVQRDESGGVVRVEGRPWQVEAAFGKVPAWIVGLVEVQRVGAEAAGCLPVDNEVLAVDGALRYPRAQGVEREIEGCCLSVLGTEVTLGDGRDSLRKQRLLSRWCWDFDRLRLTSPVQRLDVYTSQLMTPGGSIPSCAAVEVKTTASVTTVKEVRASIVAPVEEPAANAQESMVSDSVGLRAQASHTT
jgi:hypothetical protein